MEPRHPNRRAWIIVGISFAAVVALVVGFLVWQSGSGDSGVPSADEGVDRTVGLLTEKDPVCDDWIRYADELAERTKEWSEIDKTISAANWSSEQRLIAEDAADAMSTAADQFESILPMAANVVLRELIAQSIVFSRAFVERMPEYEYADAMLAGVAGNFGTATTFMCTAMPIVLARKLTGESSISSTDNPARLTPFLADEREGCDTLVALLDRQNSVLRGWASGDPSVPASKWTAEDRKLNEAAIPVLEEDAKQARLIADKAENSVLSDLLHTYASYLLAFAQALPSYEPDDDQLWKVVISLGGGLGAACEARL
ncbi:hypothetical protein [Mycobacterium sp. SMC-4]|uniref:hypothetical protein n=1 Tax=Mycobacterium sp. SMC-4 TaxID=2857059 RepID=UPI003D058A10